MKIFQKKQKAEAATAVTAEDQSDHQFDESSTLERVLEREIENDPAAKAALELETFSMTPGAKLLLDRAMDNLARNDGANIEDPDARLAIRQRSQLVDAAGNDLSIVIAALVDSCERPQEIPPAVYSTCFNVLKAAVFIANLDYRQYLDPRGDFDIAPYLARSAENEALNARDFEPDARSEASPLDGLSGHDTPADQAWHRVRELYGRDIEDEEDIFAASLEDLRYFLQLTCESFGWDAERPMPFAAVMVADGKFDNITDAQVALDHSEVKRQEARKRRAERDAVRLTNAAERARALLAKSVGR